MLMEQLAAGRSVISLPVGIAMGSAQGGALCDSGAYTPHSPAIQSAYRVALKASEDMSWREWPDDTYIINAAVSVTCTRLHRIAKGENPAVPSAIVKYHCTELRPQGRATMRWMYRAARASSSGPKNYLGRTYQAIPIAITVEGANILTRSLIIFGQGAIRCHPYVLKEMEAASEPGFRSAACGDFDAHLFDHIGYAVSNAARAFVLALTHAKLSRRAA